MVENFEIDQKVLLMLVVVVGLQMVVVAVVVVGYQIVQKVDFHQT